MTDGAQELQEAEASFSQERLWLLDQLHGRTGAFTIPMVFRAEGKLELAALEDALGGLVRRHETLRTTFEMAEGRLVQLITPPAPVAVAVVDVTGLPGDEREAAARRAVLTAASEPFDLAKGPLFRPLLVRLGPDSSLLAFTLHHIVSDAWSRGVLLRDLGELYAASVEGRAPRLEPLSIQYADFAAWQKRTITGERLANGLAFFTKLLEGVPPLELPTDRTRPATPTFRGEVVRFTLPGALKDQLAALGRRENATMFMTLLAAWNVLVFRYAGSRSERIVVGTPIANRTRIETESLVGIFMNTLALATDLSGDPTFRELLARVRAVCLGAYTHQEIPFEKVLAELGPERDGGRNAVFATWFVLQNAPSAPLELPSVRLTDERLDLGTAKFDLNLDIVERPDGLAGAIEYATDIFERETVERLARHLEELLRSIVARPDARISTLPLIGAAERRRLVVEWNDTARSGPRTGCVHELIERQVDRTPDSIAVVHESEAVSYRELDRRANGLARHLRRRGVGPDEPVALCVERSVDMIVAILGVLKAGGAYVPLDASYPKERLAGMLDDARVRVVVAHKKLVSSLPVRSTAIVVLDDVLAEIGHAPIERLEGAGAGPENLVYVIFTSGSTGRPKGVAVEHRQLVNYLNGVIARLDLAPGASYATVSTISADLGNTVVFPALLTGGRLHVLDDARTKDPIAFAEYFQRAPIDCLKIVPSHLSSLVAAAGAAVLPRRKLVVGGEASTWEDVDRVRSLAPACAFMNHYGPTETTVGALTLPVTGGEQRRSRTVPIGSPLHNTRVYVVDRSLELVPIGVPGELLIGGDCVVRGYIHRPDDTADRFIPDPFADIPGARVYRTGDRARWLPDGTIEFLGRIDHQVKIRGFRVELGEIEAVLRRRAGVREAIALVREDAPGEKRLVAYVVPERGIALAPDAVKDHARAALPEYMVPSAVVVLDAFPLTPNGKVDRARFPALGAARELPVAAGARTPVEATLAKVFAEALKLPDVSTTDNFFDLGIDSIMAIQIVWRTSRAGLRITPKDLFEQQTIRELARVAARAPAAGAASSPSDRDGPLPLLPNQRAFFEARIAQPHHWNQAVLLEAKTRVDARRLEEALEAVFLVHEALRSRFVRTAVGWEAARPAPRGAVPVERIDLGAIPAPRRWAALAERGAGVQASLDLEKGPVVRAAIFDLGPGEAQRILLVAHHLVIDGVSWRIILDDLDRAYDQLDRGERVALPAEATPIREWARRLGEHARSDRVRADLPYWLSAERSAIAPLPRDGEGPNTAASTREVSLALSTDDTRVLVEESPRALGCQVLEVLLAALARAVCEWSEAPRALVEVEHHGRDLELDGIDVSRTVGWFTAHVPVVLEGGATAEAVLRSVQKRLLSVPSRGASHALLLHGSGDAEVAGRLAALPRPEIIFNYVGRGDQMSLASARFALARESAGPTRSGEGARAHTFVVGAGIRDGALRIDWAYSEQLHARATVEHLVERFGAGLRAFVELARGRAATTGPVVGSGADGSDESDIVPLSANQEIFLLDYPEHWRVPLSWKLEGPLDIAALERALNELVRRHESLRTTFATVAGRVVQRIARRPRPLAVPVIDIGQLPERERDAEARRLVGELCRRHDLERGPLMRALVVRLGEDRHVLAFNVHHAISDGVSYGVMSSELSALYRGFKTGEAPALEEPYPYRRFVATQQRRFDVEGVERRNLAYWRQKLAGRPPVFTVGRPRPARGPVDGAFPGGRHEFRIPDAVAAAVDELRRAERTTTFSALLAAFFVLLRRLTRKDDIIIAFPVIGRDEASARALGCFLNVVPIRAQLAEAPTFRSLLRRVHADALEAHEHAEYGMARLWEDQRAGADETALWGILFNYLPRSEPFSLHGVAAKRFEPSPVPVFAFDLHFMVVEISEGGLACAANYNAAVIDPPFLERLGREYVALLRYLAGSPDTSIESASLEAAVAAST